MVARLFGKVPFRNQTIWLPGHLLSRLNERDGLSGGARTGGAVSHYHTVAHKPHWGTLYYNVQGQTKER